MASLRRTRDGEGEVGARVEAIAWNEDGTFKEIIGHKPTIGCSLLVGSVTARSYSSRDYWLTTPITEILEEESNDEYYYCKFKTENSDYEFWSGNVPTSKFSWWKDPEDEIKDKNNSDDNSDWWDIDRGPGLNY